MKNIVARHVSVLLFLLLGIKNIHGEDFKSSQLTRRIVGGRECQWYEHPYIVSIQDSSDVGHICAGTLIRPKWVLTVRHPIESLCSIPLQLYIVAGSLIAYRKVRESSRRDPAIQMSAIVKCYFDIGPATIFNIAMLQLRTPINQTSFVKFARLPFNLPNATNNLKTACRTAKIAGWGIQHTYNKSRASSNETLVYNARLQCIESHIISVEECSKAWANLPLYPTIFCTFKENQSVCHGDAGGPVMCNSYIYGIISAGRRDCIPSPKHPSVYLRIDYFKNFIEGTISKFTKFPKSSYDRGNRWSRYSSTTYSLNQVLEAGVVALALYFCKWSAF